MHMVFIVAHTGEHDDGYLDVDVADKGGQGDAVDLGHLEVYDDNFAVVMGEPSGGFEAVGERFGGMSFLAEISDEESSDAWVIVDDKELRRRSLGEVHAVLYFPY